MPLAHPENAPGDWYVELGCGLICSVPLDIAPELFAWAHSRETGEVNHCYVKQQPRAPNEVEKMVEAAWTAEAACIRFGGRDQRVIRQLCERGAEEAIDRPE